MLWIVYLRVISLLQKDDSDMDVESSNMVETLTNPRNVGVEQEKTMEQDEIEKETTNNDQASLEQLSNLVPHTEDMQDIGVVPESQFSYSIQAESIQKNDESGEIVDEGGDLKAEDRKESLQPKTRDSRFKLDPLVVEEPENKSKPGSEIDQEMESEVDMLEDKELEHGADLEHVSDQDLDMELDQKPEIEVEMQPKSEPETDMMIGPEIEPSFNGLKILLIVPSSNLVSRFYNFQERVLTNQWKCILLQVISGGQSRIFQRFLKKKYILIYFMLEDIHGNYCEL